MVAVTAAEVTEAAVLVVVQQAVEVSAEVEMEEVATEPVVMEAVQVDTVVLTEQ